MKKIVFLLFSTLSAFYGLCQQNSLFTVSTTGNSNIRLRFNDKQYSLQDRSATFQNVKPGNYAVVIYQQRAGTNGSAEYAEVFNSIITIKPQTHLEICVLRFGKTVKDESTAMPDDWNNDYDTNPVASNVNGGELKKIPDNIQFDKIKKAVKDQYYDQEKLVYAKVIVKDNWFIASQVTELCSLFSYDDAKLNMAKYAYDRCVDKGNYFNVTNVFYYSENKNELMRFIGSK